jgi:hypothetical protein
VGGAAKGFSRVLDGRHGQPAATGHRARCVWSHAAVKLPNGRTLGHSVCTVGPSSG